MKNFVLVLLFLQTLNLNFIAAQDVNMYCFGHSLIDHAESFSGEPNTNILHWINDIATFSNQNFAAGGQYGFLTSHDDLPPSANWGWASVPASWDGDNETFAEADINTILLTAANFIQYQAPQLPHPLDNTTTVLKSTRTIFDWVNTEEPSNVTYYIYGNWPEMDLANAFPPTTPLQSEIDLFHNNTMTGQFPDWWKTYQDSMLDSRPLLNTRLIPVGNIISQLLTNTSLFPTAIPFDSLYSDSAPHGRPNLYFLAGMITYMAIFEQNIPNNYDPGSSILPSIKDSLSAISNYAWRALNQFNLPNGDSRVFSNTTLALEWPEQFTASQVAQTISLQWLAHEPIEQYIIEYSQDGSQFNILSKSNTEKNVPNQKQYNYIHKHPLNGRNYYRIKQINLDGSYNYSNTVFVNFVESRIFFSFPSPVQSKLNIEIDYFSYAKIYNQSGQIISKLSLIKGINIIDIESLEVGVYHIRTNLGDTLKFVKI